MFHPIKMLILHIQDVNNRGNWGWGTKGLYMGTLCNLGAIFLST